MNGAQIGTLALVQLGVLPPGQIWRCVHVHVLILLHNQAVENAKAHLRVCLCIHFFPLCVFTFPDCVWLVCMSSLGPRAKLHTVFLLSSSVTVRWLTCDLFFNHSFPCDTWAWWATSPRTGKCYSSNTLFFFLNILNFCDLEMLGWRYWLENLKHYPSMSPCQSVI